MQIYNIVLRDFLRITAYFVAYAVDCMIEISREYSVFSAMKEYTARHHRGASEPLYAHIVIHLTSEREECATRPVA